MANTKKAAAPKKKATVTAQAKGRMVKAQKEQQASREKKIQAYQMSGYNSSKFQDPKTKKFSSGDGSLEIAPAQYGNPRPNARNAAKNAAFGARVKLAKKGK